MTNEKEKKDIVWKYFWLCTFEMLNNSILINKIIFMTSMFHIWICS